MIVIEDIYFSIFWKKVNSEFGDADRNYIHTQPGIDIYANNV